jgi:hypothetical protein
MYRTKRKMSGPAVSIAMDLDKRIDISDDPLDNLRGGRPSAISITLSAGERKWCELCDMIDIREVLSFMMWEAMVVLIVVLAVFDWIYFFKFVVEPEEHHVRAKWGGLWVLFTACLMSFRHYFRSKCGQNVRNLADHAEIFVTVSLVMVFSTNVAFYLHLPSATPLRDIGFMLIPEQGLDSPWRPVSDILTAGVPVFFMLQTYFMTRDNRCRVMSTFFRVATISYTLRMLTVSLTSLPGPAPHCRPGSDEYFPPQNWIDILTRVGPMYGKFNSCGDLIFSGHMSYTNSALLLYLRTLDRYFKCYSRVRWTIGITYLFVLAGLCLSGRKHYTVDVVLGIMISTLVYFHFEHGWVPMCFQYTSVIPLHQQYLYKRYSNAVTEDDEKDRLLPVSSSSSSSPTMIIERKQKVDPVYPVEFVC